MLNRQEQGHPLALSRRPDPHPDVVNNAGGYSRSSLEPQEYSLVVELQDSVVDSDRYHEERAELIYAELLRSEPKVLCEVLRLVDCRRADDPYERQIRIEHHDSVVVPIGDVDSAVLRDVDASRVVEALGLCSVGEPADLPDQLEALIHMDYPVVARINYVDIPALGREDVLRRFQRSYANVISGYGSNRNIGLRRRDLYAPEVIGVARIRHHLR